MPKQKTEQIEVHGSILKYMYFELKDVLASEQDLLQNNITNEFYDNMDECIEHNIPLNIAIKGDVGSSKSTVAWVIDDYQNTRIEKKIGKKIDRYKTCFSDQIEFIRFTSNEEWDKAIIVDEFSRIAETGLNATTESALLDYYSDVFAQRRINKIACSPSRIMDKNATIILEYIGKNEEKLISRFKVIYRDVADGYNMRTLGYVDFYVGDIIKKDFYLKYREKKFKRMELLDKHGVRDIRDLEFSGIVLQSIEILKGVIKDGNKADLTDLIHSVVSKVCRKEKRIYSYLTLTEIGSRVRAIISLYSMEYKTEIKLQKAKTEMERVGLLDKFSNVKKLLKEELEEQEKRYKLYNEYLDIK